MTQPRFLLPTLALILTACAGPSTDRPADAPDATTGAATDEADAIEEHVKAARTAFEAGDPGAALAEVDRGLELAPGRQDLLLARADGLVLLARQLIAEQANGLFVISSFEDAVRAYDACEPTPRVLLGKSHALAQLGRGVEAWTVANEARALADRTGERFWSPLVGQEDADAEAIVAEAAYLGFAERADGRAADDPAAPTYDEAFATYANYVALRRDDATAWSTLANLHLYRSVQTDDVADTRRALDAVRSGLEHLPDDPTLLPRLVELSARVGGARGAAEATAAYADRYPLSAAGRFNAAKALFDLGIAEFPVAGAEAGAVETARARFERVDQWFARVVDIEAETEAAEGWGSSAQGWRAVARIARGWVDYWAGENDGAERWFLAANEVFPRGIEWSIEGLLQSGIQGLYALSTRAAEAGDLVEAARLADRITELVPHDGDFANNAGFLNRDLAVAIELEGRAALEAGDEARAAELFETALRVMERSAAAYDRAAELLPDDVRVVNDAALVHVYYLHDDLERSEERLMHSVRQGEEQLAALAPDDPAFPVLAEAWGDAHENLGVLWLEHESDPESARLWFDRAVEIGPNPRPMITEVWFARPEFADANASGPDDHTVLDWARLDG